MRVPVDIFGGAREGDFASVLVRSSGPHGASSAVTTWRVSAVRTDEIVVVSSTRFPGVSAGKGPDPLEVTLDRRQGLTLGWFFGIAPGVDEADDVAVTVTEENVTVLGRTFACKRVGLTTDFVRGEVHLSPEVWIAPVRNKVDAVWATHRGPVPLSVEWTLAGFGRASGVAWGKTPGELVAELEQSAPSE